MKKKNVQKKVMAMVGTAMLLQSVAPVVASASESNYYQITQSTADEKQKANLDLNKEKGEITEVKINSDQQNTDNIPKVDWSLKEGNEKVPIEAWENISTLIKQIQNGLYKNIKDVTFDDIRTFKGVYNKDKDFVGLDLSGQELKDVPTILKEMQELRYLDLSRNDIADYPQWIMDFKQLDKETNVKLSKLISWGRLKPKAVTKQTAESKPTENNKNENTQETQKSNEPVGEGGKIYETWNRTAGKPLITANNGTDNKSSNDNLDQYISTDNEVVNISKGNPNSGNVSVNSGEAPVEEASKGPNVTVTTEQPVTEIQGSSVETLPQTGSFIGTSLLGVLGICAAAIGGFLFKRKKGIN